MLGRNRHSVLTSTLPVYGRRTWRRTWKRDITRNLQSFRFHFRFRNECHGVNPCKTLLPSSRKWKIDDTIPIVQAPTLVHLLSPFSLNVKPGILEGLRGVMLRFSLLPFTGLSPHSFSCYLRTPFHISWLLFIAYSCAAMHSTLTYAQRAYSCAARLLIPSALTHAQHAQPYCTVYKDSMDILFQ